MRYAFFSPFLSSRRSWTPFLIRLPPAFCSQPRRREMALADGPIVALLLVAGCEAGDRSAGAGRGVRGLWPPRCLRGDSFGATSFATSPLTSSFASTLSMHSKRNAASGNAQMGFVSCSCRSMGAGKGQVSAKSAASRRTTREPLGCPHPTACHRTVAQHYEALRCGCLPEQSLYISCTSQKHVMSDRAGIRCCWVRTTSWT